MKNLKTTALVFHAWAHQAYPSARSNSVSYEGNKLYSYAACIAKLHDNNIVIFADRTWSVTTSSHQSDARQATSHMKRVYCRDPEASPQANKVYIEDRIARLLKSIPTPVMTKKGVEAVNSVKARERTQACALSLVKQCNDYLAVVAPEIEQINTLTLNNYKVLLERREAEEKMYREAAEKAAALAAVERLEKWRAHDPHVRTSNLHALPAALRLSPDNEWVETSHGANIPTRDALKLWPFVQRVKREGKDLSLTGGIKLGHYKLDSISKEGNIVVGCHKIAYAELEMMAKKLELIP